MNNSKASRNNKRVCLFITKPFTRFG